MARLGSRGLSTAVNHALRSVNNVHVDPIQQSGVLHALHKHTSRSALRALDAMLHRHNGDAHSAVRTSHRVSELPTQVLDWPSCRLCGGARSPHLPPCRICSSRASSLSSSPLADSVPAIGPAPMIQTDDGWPSCRLCSAPTPRAAGLPPCRVCASRAESAAPTPPTPAAPVSSGAVARDSATAWPGCRLCSGAIARSLDLPACRVCAARG